MKIVVTALMSLFLFACSSTPKRPEAGECMRKDTKNYRERVYKVKKWEADGTPYVRDLVTGRMKSLLEYRPKFYRTVDCPK